MFNLPSLLRSLGAHYTLEIVTCVCHKVPAMVLFEYLNLLLQFGFILLDSIVTSSLNGWPFVLASLSS